MEFALTASKVSKTYGQVKALDEFDLQVSPGTVQGLLGPNGAGKTTMVRTFATLARLESGEATVAGFDVRREPGRIRTQIVGREQKDIQTLGGSRDCR